MERLLDTATEVARGLQEAHSKGVVHRDINPADIVLTASDQAVLMDFGLAQVAAGRVSLMPGFIGYDEPAGAMRIAVLKGGVTGRPTWSPHTRFRMRYPRCAVRGGLQP